MLTQNKVVLFEFLRNEVKKRSYAKRAYMHLTRDMCYARIKMHNIIPTISANAITKRLIPESSTMLLMLLISSVCRLILLHQVVFGQMFYQPTHGNLLKQLTDEWNV